VWVSLDDIAVADRARVGGKAYQLAALAREGFPVPPGFVVPVDVFHAFIADLGVADAVVRAAAGDAAAAQQIVATLTTAAFPAWFRRTLIEAAAALGPRLAVRSSGVDEDGKNRSFAGQHETVLGVRPAEVPDAVRRCWASAWNERAIAYRGRSPGGTAAMAVVVQRMVAPRASGVLFTVNPMSGSWREMTVEAVPGLGEALVSGQLEPHFFLVRRPRRLPGPIQRAWSRLRLEVSQQTLPPIPRYLTADGWRDAADPKRPTLSRTELLRLCRLGLRVERRFGAPQDVEWAIDDGGVLYLLQARPITASGPARPRDDVVFTRRFLGERWPDVATPLGWSMLAPIFTWFIAYPKTEARYLGGGAPIRLVRGRPYLNVTVFRHLAFKLPGAPAPRFMIELLPPAEAEAWQRRFAVMPDLEVYASILSETLAERRWERFRWNPITNHQAWDQFEARLARELPLLSRAPSSERDAIRLLDDQLRLVRDYVSVHITSLLFANLFDQLLEALLWTWIPSHAARLHEQLATAPGGNLTLETNAALWDLAQQATDADLAALDAGRAVSPSFDALLGAFLARFGQRAAASWEIFHPRWADDPRAIVPMLRSFQAGQTEDPRARSTRQDQAFQDAMVELHALVPSHEPPLRRWVLDQTVFLTRRYLLLRENQRFWFDRLLFAIQRTAYALGDRLVEQRYLEHREQVALLTWEELRSVSDEAPDVVRGWIARRERQRAEDVASVAPVFLRGESGCDPVSGPRLQGAGISPGRATGRVRILRSPAEAHRLSPGDVLVAHAVDPGWTPLFLQVSALVLEMGSRLSHGAVVAREYGLPAVVNIDGVTRRLVDGQEVTVDGTRGIVWVHP
jgi:phosphohistidine swiveling domain-containing protein